MTEFKEENDELLETLENPESNQENRSLTPKTGTKGHIITRIEEVCQKHELLLQETQTVLKRKSKEDLKQLLANYCELAMQREIEKKLKMNCPQESSSSEREKLMACSMIRMLHDSLLRATEKGVHSYTSFTIQGFCDNLKQDGVSQQVDQCLMEIMDENDLTGYIKSPYARLLICYSTSIMKTLRKKPAGIIQHNTNKKNVRFSRTVEPERTPAKKKLGNDSSRK
jgi:uncharacterized membrane-anchored protein YjiN (DUF445 family)